MHDNNIREKAPSFTLLDQHGASHSIQAYRGKWLVLYFYPKDETPGCVKEACSFRDARELIADLGNAMVVGVSTDSVESHRKFAEAHSLPFTLLSDPTHEVIDAYDSWDPTYFFGKELLGTKRNTFLINPDGYIVKKYLGVNPSNHATEIIKDLQLLQDYSNHA